MEKPYVKKFCEIEDFKVWIVDGAYIRGNVDEEFTNCGQHFEFKFIPQDEFWIDRVRTPGEEKYYIDSMMMMNRLIAKGESRAKAIETANKIEKRERAKSKLMREELKIKSDKKLTDSVHVKPLKTYGRKVKVWIVNGEAVRDLFFIDFTEGGHDKVYPFIPANEIWIDDDVFPKERKFVFLHEVHERNLMSEGMCYDDAHKDSSKIELYCRTHPEETEKKIKIEIAKE
ncbi:MAG: hypothetical protein V1888_03565 [archaeon]